MPWIDEHGELSDECPQCEQTRQDAEVQMRAMEMERRKDRAARTRAENAAAKAEEFARDGATWKAAVKHWQETFPNSRVTSTGIRSARATAYFQRLDSGAGPGHINWAISAAKEYPYVVFGKRRRTGSKDDLAIDLQQIVSVGNDAQFDFLVEIGRKMEEEPLF